MYVMIPSTAEAGTGTVKKAVPCFNTAWTSQRTSTHEDSQDGRVRARASALAELRRAPQHANTLVDPQQRHSAPEGLSPQKKELSGSGCERLDFGYSKNLEEFYDIGKELGAGGNGVVRVATCKVSGMEFACKSIPKRLDTSASDKKRDGHADAVKREIEALRRLQSCLNVAKMEAVFEDDTHVHIVMELCKGGELVHAIGQSHYSERTVASYMRAVLRTLAQCHAEHILHRDIKPGNFMLLDDGKRAPLKAIDFGLAVPFDPEGLPLDNLGLEGTPWYQAPEVLSSAVGPESDIWSAGVMAFQLLTGRFPFNDRRNPFHPSLSQVWKSILTHKLDFNKPYWEGISEEAKDIVRLLLDRDPKQRPSAKEALKHPWLRGEVAERRSGKPLGLAVVGRIQRYGKASCFKRTVLEMIAEELMCSPTSCSAAPEPLQDGGARPVVDDVHNSSLQYLYDRMSFAEQEAIDADTLATGLRSMGYRLRPQELERLIEQIRKGPGSNTIPKSHFAASQIDWGDLQGTYRDRWLGLARSVFQELDADGNGFIEQEEMLQCLASKLPPGEVHEAVQRALQEAGPFAERAGGMDFESFMAMLSYSPSSNSLDMYDDRCSADGSTRHGSNHPTADGSNGGKALAALAQA